MYIIYVMSEKNSKTQPKDESTVTEKSPELSAALAETDWDKARLIELMDGFLDQCNRYLADDVLSVKELNSITLTVARIIRERKIIIDGYYEERAPLKQEEKLAADQVTIIHLEDVDDYEAL